MDKFEINIGLFGCVSVGKSTFINAIAGQQYSDTEIKKTTMVPQVYIESDTNALNAEVIRKTNREINNSIESIINVNNFDIEKCQPICHNVDRICDLFDPNIIDSRLRINIYDIPGMNDSASKNIYSEWVRQNIKKFDIIIFMTEINRGLNNSDEIEILNILMDAITKYKSKMICLMNKCDDIYFDNEQNDLVFEEKEQENIYIQANNILADIAKNHNIDCTNGSFTPFYPISSETCFIYRALLKNPQCKLDQIHINRLCKNECGPNQWKKMDNEQKENIFSAIIDQLKDTYNSKIKDTGYLTVKSIIQNTVATNKMDFFRNHLNNNLQELELFNVNNIHDYVELIKKYNNKLIQAKSYGVNISHELFWQKIKSTVSNYIDNIKKINTKIINYKDFIDFKNFETLHSNMQIHCMNFSTLIETIKDYAEYPKEFVEAKQKELMFKILCIYDQITNYVHKDNIHMCPSNLVQYLQIIKTYVPQEFDKFSLKFLNISCNPVSKHFINYQKELQELIIYIIDNIGSDLHTCCSLMTTMLLNKQSHIFSEHQDQYFSYIIKIKKLVGIMNKMLPPDEYTPLDILYEVTNKNISLYLTTNSVTNFYKQDMDLNKINMLLNNFLQNTIPNVDVEFEGKILWAFINKKLKN
jgi:small GTP-binding protein